LEKGSRILLMGLLSLGIYLTILYLQFQTPYVVIFSGLDGARGLYRLALLDSVIILMWDQ
jgi:uncharacterized membrane protein